MEMSIIPASTVIEKGLDAAAKDKDTYAKDKAAYMNKFCLGIIDDIQCNVRKYPNNKSKWYTTCLKSINDFIRIANTGIADREFYDTVKTVMKYYDESILVNTLQNAGYRVTTYIEKETTTRWCFVRVVLFPQVEKYKISVA
jgi:hypothetical protein